MEYLVVIHRDREDGPCGVTVPDLPGCWSGGDTLAEALANAREGIAVHVEALLEAGLVVPEPSATVDSDGGIVAAVPLDDGLLSERAVRVNVTIPSRLLKLIDRRAGQRGRSGLLAEAVLAHLGHLGRRKPPPPTTPAKDRGAISASRADYTNNYMIAAQHRDDPSAVRVGPWPDTTGWSAAYFYTVGCCFSGWPPRNAKEHGRALLNEAANLMFLGGNPRQVLQEFAKIKAWRDLRSVQFAGQRATRTFISGNPDWNPHN